MPSPYGFLSTLLLAVVPTATAWQSLYLANAAATAILGICLYFALRAVQPRPLGSVIALAASAAVVFLVSTYPPTLSPEHYVPMSGAYSVTFANLRAVRGTGRCGNRS